MSHPRPGRPPLPLETGSSARWERWAQRHVLLTGTLALAWLLLRTVPKPSRLVYPCQQAAFGAASLAFGGPLVVALLLARRRAVGWLRSPLALGALVLGSLALIGTQPYGTGAEPYAGPRSDPPRDYRALLYHVEQCPEDPAGDRFVGLDNLLTLMAREEMKFYRSEVVSTLSGPDGLIASDDVVLIKINYQWGERGGTNTDLLRGLIRRVVDHPDGFTGEVVVVENAQFASTSGFDRSQNNAQDITLSPHDVVVWFQDLGYDVSHFDWTPVRYTQVEEYSAGDDRDGYVVAAYDAEVQGRPSYPKFRTAAGTRISAKHGIWDPGSSTYSRERFRFLNVPVLKSHHAVYGATVSVKHYMGVVTRELSTNSHSAIRYGILGEVLGQIHLADLNILDAIWINANPSSGPSTPYSVATRCDELVASLDPVALDIWSVKNILIPAFLDNGYSPPWPAPSADPDDPSSAFRTYLDNSMHQLLDAGVAVTNDLAQIDVRHGRGDAGDFDRDGRVDLDDRSQFAACFTGEGGGPLDPGCAPGDFDGDDDVDCTDWSLFRTVWTEAAPPPDLPECSSSGIPPETDLHGARLGPVVPNPSSHGASIRYFVPASSSASLSLYDASGRMIRRLRRGPVDAGDQIVHWDGRNEAGLPVAPGMYHALLRVSGREFTVKIAVR
jgi:uncharacterized protein (DUF362 family)